MKFWRESLRLAYLPPYPFIPSPLMSTPYLNEQLTYPQSIIGIFENHQLPLLQGGRGRLTHYVLFVCLSLVHLMNYCCIATCLIELC